MNFERQRRGSRREEQGDKEKGETLEGILMQTINNLDSRTFKVCTSGIEVLQLLVLQS